MRVLIVGAGLGGLALAHALRNHGVDATVFERNLASADGLAGYGLHLDRDGWTALSKCLTPNGLSRLDGIASHAGTILRFSTEHLRPLAERDEAWLTRSDPRTVERRGVGRLALRDLLLSIPAGGAGLDIRWGKEFTHYRESEHTVTAVFADGSEVEGDVLVGADASHSRVRRQRLPSLEREDLAILNIAGRYPLDAARRKGLPTKLVDGSLNNIVPAGPIWMFTSAWLLDGSAPSRHEDENSDYVVWAFAARRGSYPADVDDLTSEALRDHVLARIDGWAPALKQLVREGDAATIARIPLRSMPMLADWSSSRVTLVGDAIHNMTPMAGIGANTALRDAATLSRSLIEAAEADGDPVPHIARYERAMRDYANIAIAKSRHHARRATSGSPAGRRAFRMALATAERVPAVKRLLFAR